MGFGGISPWSLLLILLIVIMLFGTKRLKNIGGDLGGAIKSFKKSMSEGEAGKSAEADPKKLDAKNTKAEDRVIEGQVSEKDKA